MCEHFEWRNRVNMQTPFKIKSWKYSFVELSKWIGTSEPIRLITDLGRVGLKFFYKFQCRLIFDPAHLEPGSLGLNPWWAGLAHQPANKRSHKCFYFFLLSWVLHLGHMLGCFFIQHINNLYFFIILVYIWIVLKFI